MNLLDLARPRGRGVRSLFNWEPRGEKFKLANPAPCIKPATPTEVLVVDDDPVILRTTAARLASAGYHVTTAVDGSEAIRALGSHKPKFILVDVSFPPDVANGGVPAWDGFRLMTWLRGLANTRDSRYIVISGSEEPSMKEQARLAGAVAYFPKPIDHQELLSVFEKENQSSQPTPRRWWTAFFDFL